ncbi:MAG: YSC84-related protein [Aquisalimonadaceae bacterium]
MQGYARLVGTWSLMVLVVLLLLVPAHADAASAREIDAGVDTTLERFNTEVQGASEFLASAQGVLVFPRVIKAGLGVGGEYGEGALRIDGETVDYYSTAAASIGFQMGAQAKSVILVFMTREALADFRASDGWKVGVDGSVALVDVGAGRSLDTNTIRDPVVGFVFGQKGLMFNVTLEGSRLTKLNK